MANARPPSGGNTPTARIGIDLSAFRGAASVARESGQATAREIANAFRVVTNEQRIAIETAKQATLAIRGQQEQLTASTRAASAERQQAARAESVTQQQAARAATATTIEEQRRATAAYKAELKERERAQRQSQVSASAFGQGAAAFAGSAFGGPIGGIAGALAGGGAAGIGLAAGLAVRQGAQFAIDASQVAVAYDRQRVAAVNLAGSQARLNDLLKVYDQATGGIVNKSEALANVTKLMSVGFADSREELDQFATAIRGISIAMGTTADTVTQNLILELFSQRGQRLDQLGLNYQEVRKRADELKAADSGLTQQMAYQQAVLEQAINRFGSLAKSAEGGATGIESLTKAWSDFQLEAGKQTEGPVNAIAGAAASAVNYLAQEIGRADRLMDEYEAKWKRQLPPGSHFGPSAMSTGIRPPSGPAGLSDEETAAYVDRSASLRNVNNQAAGDIADQNRSFGRQRAKAESDYQKGVLREQEDFTRKRLLQERKFNLSLLDVAQDSARARVKWEADVQREIEERRQDRDDRIGEIDEKYAKDREKRERDHRKRLLDAAANLDAVAVREEQERYAEEKKDAADAHQEQIDDANDAFAKFEADQRDSLQRRIDEQKANDEQRIADMRQAFEDQKAEEDAQREVDRGRREDDHAAQMAEMDNQQAERIQQIKDHAQQQRDEINEQFKKDLAAVGTYVDGYKQELDRIVTAAINSGRAYINGLLPGAGHPSLADPYDNGSYTPTYTTPAPASSTHNSTSRNVYLSPGALVINMSEGMTKEDALELMADFLEDQGN